MGEESDFFSGFEPSPDTFEKKSRHMPALFKKQILLYNFCYNAGAYCSATFTDSELKSDFHCDGSDKLD